MAMPPNKRFFCFTKEKVEGPFTLIELAGLLRGKQIDGDTPVCSEGSEEWIVFRDRPEIAFVQEMPAQMIDQHFAEQTAATESSWSPKKLLMFLWIMAPVFLYLAYRFLRMYIIYHLTNDPSAVPDADTSGSS